MRAGTAIVLLVLAACATVQAAAPRQRTDDTIRVRVRLVSAPTLVFSKKGQLLEGLDTRDFELMDNGVRQKISMDAEITPPAVAIAVQANSDVQEYIPFIQKVGSVVDALLLGQRGTAAVLTYGDSIVRVTSFEQQDVRTALQKIPHEAHGSRMFDAGAEAIALLKKQAAARTRVLLVVGQPFDKGSHIALEALKQQAEEENVTIYCLTLPVLGKKFVSDTFSLRGVGQADKGGFVASAELTKLIPALNRAAKANAGSDAFSQLTADTGGTQIHFRKQTELENAIIMIGRELRSSYLLRYSPLSDVPGYHRIAVSVDVPGARTYTRPGYWRSE